jgi:hypothetical protein
MEMTIKKPAHWKGSSEEWREFFILNYVLSQGCDDDGDEERYAQLCKKHGIINKFKRQ